MATLIKRVGIPDSVKKFFVNDTLTVGGNRKNGVIRVLDKDGTLRVSVNASENAIRVFSADGNLIAAFGVNGSLSLGGSGHDGDFIVCDEDGEATVRVRGSTGNITLGGNGKDGDVIIKNSSGETTIKMDGDSGDITLSNADFAEDFSIAQAVETKPGMVMIINREGELEPCTEANDKRVVGVISGAGVFKPGIIMDKQAGSGHRSPVSLMGKVMCLVDATYRPVEPGDMLTTSPTLGHAMRVHPGSSSGGTILGKALSGISSGTGLVKMLITLQ